VADSSAHGMRNLLTVLRQRLDLAGHFFSSIRKRGVWRTTKIAIYELYYEAKFGIKTGYVITTRELDGDAEALRHATDYFPSSYLILHEVFAHNLVNSRDAVLVDYGCGLGRTLLFASTLPFKTIIGVELSPMLCAVATKNLEQYYARQHKTQPEWRVINIDARRFDIPNDANIFYFFNPFDAVVLADAIDAIIESVRRAPRKCLVVYANPIHASLMFSRGLARIPSNSNDFILFWLGPNAPEPDSQG
jgi:SAM-dependent methyltransferase